MARTWRFFILALPVWVASACAPITVGSHVDRAVAFNAFHTYDWGPPDALPLGDPRLQQDPDFQDRFEGAVERTLAAKGYTRRIGAADLLIHYHAAVGRRIEVNRVDREHGFCAGENCLARVTEVEASSLVLDIVDARTNRLVWRGWAQRDLEGMLGRRNAMRRVIDTAVAGMLASLPDAR